jgi:uncharacterized membrane protein
VKFPAKKDIKKYLTRMAKLSDRNVYIVSVMLALAVVTALLVYSYISLRKPNEFISMYVFDSQKKAEKYPELFIIGQNNTCQLWVIIENHMEIDISCKLQLKITNTPLSTIPVSTEANKSYETTIGKGDKWENPINITMEKPGNFHLIFELWVYDKETGKFEFSNIYIVLDVEVRES